ncbi:MAG: nucleotidyltransferase domain-containing protein [Candidatus Sulfotelmatobacter sp.]
MGEILDRRRLETAKRIEALRGELVRAEQLCGVTACVYMTGSFGRGEASSHSDLDVFIVGLGTHETPALSRLNQILVKADLIEANKKLGLPEFSADGEYLTHHTVGELLGTLGKPEDDANNTFTARLLLLLESTPLVGESAYRRIVDDVIASYWRDYQENKNKFVPAFLANDILRMWRTFCVNYEARTQSVPAEKRAKRSVKNYKLKHSRLLTCYSGLLYLLAVFSKSGTVSPTDAASMIALSPTQRLGWMLSQPELKEASQTIRQLIEGYERFLAKTEVSEGELVARFLDKETKKSYSASAFEFGDLVFAVFNAIGRGSRFHRLLVV